MAGMTNGLEARWEEEEEQTENAPVDIATPSCLTPSIPIGSL